MKIDHVAIWTENLESLKDYYVKYFDGAASSLYTNHERKFHSYFISFNSGTRLEIMTMPNIPKNHHDTISNQHQGIIHLAFGCETHQQVDEKAKQLRENGFKILSEPRRTGDGYYEFETLDPDNNRVEVTKEIQ